MASRTNTKGLDALEKVLSKPKAILDLVSSSVAEEANGLIKDGFRKETNPYGRKWLPKQKPDGRKTLSGPTGRLKSGWHIKRQDSHEILIAPSVDYAVYHQNPQPRKRLSGSDALKRIARGFDTGRPVTTLRNGPDFSGPMQLTRPRRMMIPDEAMGLPPAWERDFNEAATDAMAAIIGGDGRRVSALRRRLGINAIVGFKVL